MCLSLLRKTAEQLERERMASRVCLRRDYYGHGLMINQMNYDVSASIQGLDAHASDWYTAVQSEGRAENPRKLFVRLTNDFSEIMNMEMVGIVVARERAGN